MHVRGVEVERLPFGARNGDPLEVPVALLQAVFDELAAAHVHGARREIVVVETGLLLVRPAEKPDVEMRIAVQLDAVPPLGIVPNEVLPLLWLPADPGGQISKRSTIEVVPDR